MRVDGVEPAQERGVGGGEPVLKIAECREHIAERGHFHLVGRGGIQVLKPQAGHPQRRGNSRALYRPST